MENDAPKPECPKVSQSVSLSLSLLPDGDMGEPDAHKVYWGLEERKARTLRDLIRCVSGGDDEAAAFYMEEFESYQDLQGLLFNDVLELFRANYEIARPNRYKVDEKERTREFQEKYLTSARCHE